jgi:hypothetical protein
MGRLPTTTTTTTTADPVVTRFGPVAARKSEQ